MMNRENWKTVKLGDAVDISTGRLDANAADIDGLYPFYTCADVPLKINKSLGNYECLLLVGNGANTGKVFHNKGDFNAYQRTYILKPTQVEYCRYLYWFLSQKTNYFMTRSIGSATNYIKLGDIQKLQLPLPPLNVQKQIALNLDQVTKVIAEHKELLAKYDLLIKSRFIEMFGDPVTNPMGWEVKKLGETGSCKNGMNFHYDENGVELNCLGVGDFKDYSIINGCEKLPQVSLNELPSEEYLLKNEDLVFVRSNGNKDLVGRCVAVYPNELKTTFSGFCIRFRQESNLFVTDYLLRVLKTESMRKRMAGRGANIQNLNQQILTNLDIPVPPLELQQQFANFIQQIDKSKLVVQQSLEKAETLYKSLMQEYFG